MYIHRTNDLNKYNATLELAIHTYYIIPLSIDGDGVATNILLVGIL